jgi:hypothetical protein
VRVQSLTLLRCAARITSVFAGRAPFFDSLIVLTPESRLPHSTQFNLKLMLAFLVSRF